MKRKKMNVMVLPVGTSCNLACRYCYHFGKVGEKIAVMSEEVLSRVINGATEIADDVDFLWHGGEPLLAGRDFYAKALLLQKNINFRGQIKNIIQTNATLMDDTWADFLTQNNFGVGISLDGPESMNDQCRITKDGKGTFRKVVEGIKKIQARRRNVGCITLATKYNVCNPEEVWKNARELKIPNLALHFCSSTRWGNSDEITPSPQETLEFCKKLFDLWVKEDDPSFRIRNFVNVIRADNGAKPLDCAHQSSACRFFVAIDRQGNVFPCHRFANDINQSIGNVCERSLADVIDSSQKTYSQMMALPRDCKRCKSLKACGNGCAYERLMANGAFRTKSPHCEVNRKLISHIQKWERKCVGAS